MPKNIDIREVKRAVCAHLPGQSQSHIKPITTGKFNSSFTVSHPDFEWVIRIAPPRDSVFVFYEKNMMRQEPGIHALLLEKTTVPVASIVVYDDSRAVIDRDFIIMEKLPGKPVSNVSCEIHTVLSQIGEYLAQTHRQRATTYGYIGEHHPMPEQARWVDAFHIMWNRLIDGIVEVGYYSEFESCEMRRLLDKHIHFFDRDVPSSLWHMDVWAQNILVDEDSYVTGLIDWDRALWGDPEIEFAVLDYCGISEPAFWEGYGRSRDTSAEANVRRVFYLLYELQKYIIIRHGRGNDPRRARQYKAQVYGILERSGLK